VSGKTVAADEAKKTMVKVRRTEVIRVGKGPHANLTIYLFIGLLCNPVPVHSPYPYLVLPVEQNHGIAGWFEVYGKQI